MENKNNDFVCLQSTVLDINGITMSVLSPDCGAISTFIGTTRDNFEQKKVLKLSYEAYEPMAVKEIQKICDQIRSKWDVGKIAIYHRLGEVPVLEASIVIAISSSHRQESLQAVQFAIDAVKSTVPIWKKEIYENDETQWKENKECLWKKCDNLKEKKIVDEIHSKVDDSNTKSTNKIVFDASKESNSVDYSMCQIKRNVNEMFNRIELFCTNKKQRASAIKLQENCIYRNQGSDRGDDNTSVCSRVNIIWTKHLGLKNRGGVYRAYNRWCHQDVESSVQTKSKVETSNYPPALEERLSTTERILGINRPVPKDVYQRIKVIEDRILFLESTSPEYKNLWANVMKEKPEKSSNGYYNFKDGQSKKRAYSTSDSDSES